MTPAQCEVLGRVVPRARAKIHLIPQGVDTQLFRPPSESRCHRPEHLRALYLGRISFYDKGVDLLPKVVAAAAQRGANIHLTVVGGGLDKGAFVKEINALTLGKRVTLLNACHPIDVPTILANHDVLLLPSRFEGFPNTLIEAMACGLVPIVSRLSGTTDWIVGDDAGFVCERDSLDSWCDALVRLSRERELLLKMSQAAVNRVRNHFSLDKTAQLYHKLFTGIISMNGTSRGVQQPPIPDKIARHRLFQKKMFPTARRWLRRVVARLGMLRTRMPGTWP